MPNLTSVGVTSGVPSSGTGNVSTIDAMFTGAGSPSAANVQTVQLSTTPNTTTNPLVVSNTYTTVSVSITTSNSSTTYTAGDVMGTGVNTISTIPSAGFIQGVTVTSKSANTAQMDVLFFLSSMANTTFTDNSAVAVSTQNSSSWVTTIHINDWTSGGTPATGQANGIGYQYNLSGGTAAYFALVTRGTPSIGGTSDIAVTFQILS